MEEILFKIDWNILNTYIDNNLIIANKHPEYNLWILNYSPKAQSKKFWDIYTLSCCGMVIDETGLIVARCIKKFKNFEEHDSSEIDLNQDYDVFEKMDGSFIIVFYYALRMTWIVASRDSFISEQSIEAQKMLQLKSNIYEVLNKNCTYLFEIIYQENRIVVDYGNMYDLILLLRIETKTGFELFYDDLVSLYSKHFTIVKKFNIKINDLNELKKLEEENKEGFVVRFFNGFRVKVNFNEYTKLYGILTNVSNLTIWEHLKNNYDFNALLDRVPDEFYVWMKKTTNKLQSEYNEIERLVLKEFIKIYHINSIVERKDFAMEAIKTEYRSILFKLYDKKSYDEIIWNMIRPKHSLPFKDGYDVV
jgi:RNA ligase